MRDLEKIQKLVGNVTAQDLRYVDCSVTDGLGIFVPSTGYCQYAIRPNHTHPGFMFIIFFTANQKIVTPEIMVGENQYLACVLSPNIPHVENSDGDFSRYYAIVIDQSYFEQVYGQLTTAPLPEYFWNQFTVPSDLLFYLKEFIYEYGQQSKDQNQVLDALKVTITHKLIRCLLGIEVFKQPKVVLTGIEKAKQYVEQNFYKKCEMEELASIANMSLSHFDRVFKKEYHCTPKQYLTMVRIEKAKTYLKLGEDSMIEISLRCGFSTASHFASCFHKLTGITPTEYQRSFVTKLSNKTI